MFLDVGGPELKSICGLAFAVTAPVLWNGFLFYIRTIQSSGNVEVLLKTHSSSRATLVYLFLYFMT